MNHLEVVLIILQIMVIVFLIILLKKNESSKKDSELIVGRIENYEKVLERFERLLREEMSTGREEMRKNEQQARSELTGAIATLGENVSRRIMESAEAQKSQLEVLARSIGELVKDNEKKLGDIKDVLQEASRKLREEIIGILNNISEMLPKMMNEMVSAERAQFESFSAQLNEQARVNAGKLDTIRDETLLGNKRLREEMVTSLNAISTSNTTAMTEMAKLQKSQLETMSSSIAKLAESTEKKFDDLRATVEQKLGDIRAENSRQLDSIRQTVDEKLQGTLEKRLGESFRQVSERLELVHRGLGEMRNLANGVGDLKKVLVNVKTRGTWGEVQLGAMLEQVLAPEQFVKNVAVKEGGERVEFAVRITGQGPDRDETVLLPIDAKFPLEDYQRLIEAQEKVDVEATEIAGRQLENRLKSCAKDISEKYLNPPVTTDFGILFLPVEGLFAEVIRRTGLVDMIQREYRVVVAGPTTLWALLNSLQMGFRSLAIQKRSSEVWNLLAAVKTEWMKYGDILEKVQKKLHSASETIEQAKVRSRAVGRKLRDVQELPESQAVAILPQGISRETADEDEG